MALSCIIMYHSHVPPFLFTFLFTFLFIFLFTFLFTLLSLDAEMWRFWASNDPDLLSGHELRLQFNLFPVFRAGITALCSQWQIYILLTGVKRWLQIFVRKFLIIEFENSIYLRCKES